MTSVEIRTYDDDGHDLAALVQRAWKQNFQGETWFPWWDQGYFQWRVLSPVYRNRELCLAAYEGARLVGCILAEAAEFATENGQLRGSYSSWLSVDSECRSRGVVLRLVDELRTRHRELGLRFSLGVTRADPKSPARKLWDTLDRRRPDEFCFWGRQRLWARVLNPAQMAQAGLTMWERWASQLLHCMPRWTTSGRPPKDVRPFQSDDTPWCLRMLQHQSSPAHLRMIWNPERLQHQLNGCGFPRTLVSLEESAPHGFLNYYLVTWCGRREIRVAMIDLFVGEADWRKQRRLLKAAENQMCRDGVDLVLMLSSQASPGHVLLSGGYLPIDAGVELFGLFIDSPWNCPKPRSFHILMT